MQQMQGAVRSYAWGSRTAIAELTGRPVPSPHPEAELWMGAHPGDPARILGPDGPRSLLAAIEENPQFHLGAACRHQFGDRLPYLLKVLAAVEPLSLQAHPSAQQAKDGFAAEERRSVPRDSPERNYCDEYHKPELLCALTDFDALAGFRRIDHTVALLTALNCPQLTHHLALLAGQPDPQGLRALFTTWITLPRSALDKLLPAVLKSCVDLAERDGEFAAEARTAIELGERYPGDVGVLASLLLNRVTLRAGEAIFLPAGNLHAYLRGVAVEVMANSDNVLRGGLTPKHVDVPELLRVLDFAAGSVPVLTGSPQGGERVYLTPTREFRLSRLELGPGDVSTMTHLGPQILLCTAGEVRLSSGETELLLTKGCSAWSPAGEPSVTAVAGSDGAQVFRVRAGLDEE